MNCASQVARVSVTSFVCFLLLLLLLGTSVGPASAQPQSGMPLKWTRMLVNPTGDSKNPTVAADGLAGPADIMSLPQYGQLGAEAGSLLESESKVGLRQKRDYRITISELKNLCRDPKLAESILGPGWGVTRPVDKKNPGVQLNQTYSFDDLYRDRSDRYLAKHDSGLRVRSVSTKKGKVGLGQVNFKPWGGVRTTVGGQAAGPDEQRYITSRVERMTHVGPSPDLKGLADSTSELNPLRPIQEAGMDAHEFIDPAARVPDKRTRFTLTFNGKAVADISVDQIFGYQALAGDGKVDARARHQRVTFFGMEVDIAHGPISAALGGSGDLIPGVKDWNWNKPHSAADVQRPEFLTASSMKAAYAVIGNLMQHLGAAGVRYKATIPKYTEGLYRSGALSLEGAPAHHRAALSRSGYLGGKRAQRPAAAGTK